MIVSLVGLPGSGKSTVGRQLARRLQLPFVDSDHVIEERLGCSIREYFEREGEARFRDVEESVIDELTERHQGVLSTGGGAVLRAANREHLRSRGKVIYLKSSPDELYRRLRHDTNRPLLQVDEALTTALHARGFTIAVETNGTVAPPPGLDWICVSPKNQAEVVVTKGNELKLVYPQLGVDPARFEGLAFEHFFLQPMDGPQRADNTAKAIEYCQQHPQWRLGVQSHKIIGIR